MWKDIVGSGRPKMTIWRTRVECWIPKAKNIHSEYVLFIAFPSQKWLQEGVSMLRYMSVACFVNIYRNTYHFIRQ